MADNVRCHFCHFPTPGFSGDALAMWVDCPRCGARGPAVVKTRADAEAQASAAWNAPDNRLGTLGIAKVPEGFKAATVSVAERLKIMAEGVMRGTFGEPTSMFVVFRSDKSATVSSHNMSDGDVAATINAIRDASSIRAGLRVPSSKPR